MIYRVDHYFVCLTQDVSQMQQDAVMKIQNMTEE